MSQEREATQLRRMEEMLRQSEERFNAIFNHMAVGIAQSDLTGGFILVNDRFAEIVARPKEELLRLRLSDILGPDEPGVHGGRLVELLQGGPAYTVEQRYARPDGAQIWISTSGSLIRDAADRPRHILIQVEDMTDRKLGEEANARLAALITSSDDAIISKNPDGLVLSWNPGAERLLGYTEFEMIGQSVTKVIPAERLEEEKLIMARLRRGERLDHFETVRLRKDGKLLDVSLTISPLLNARGNVVGISTIARDITERKAMERDREELLMREQAARKAAEHASRLKDEFLATVSHELRTPLNSIFGWIRMARSGMLDEPGVSRALETVERNARSQAQIIDDLLDVSRIITGRIRLDVRPVDLPSVIQAAFEVVRPTAENKGVRLHAVLDPNAGAVSGDFDRLQQAIWNLLSNAIKFTPKHGRVQVRLERVNSHVEITVSDTGDGISPDFLPYVFDRFSQGDATKARTQPGLGLGLAIVRHMVELHGGSVHAYSSGPGQGATFTVKLPLMIVRDSDRFPGDVLRRRHPSAGAGGPDAPGWPERLEGIHVLVVEDEPDARQLLVAVLESCHAEVTAVGSATEAMAKLTQIRPHLILSDIEMPQEDGYSFIRRVRAMPGCYGRTIPAIALTAHARIEDRVQALSAGYDTHIAKPFEPQELMATIVNLAKRFKPEPSGRT
jgi:PAS domain S-box-containing protein